VREPYWNRRCCNIAERRLVSSINQIPGFLKLYCQKKRGRDIDSLQLNAGGIRAALRNLVSPEGETVCVRLAIQEIDVMQTNKEADLIYRVGATIFRTVVVDRQRGCGRRTKRRAGNFAQGNRKGFVTLRVSVVNDGNRNGFGILSYVKMQRPESSQVVAAWRRNAINYIAIVSSSRITRGVINC